MIKTMATAVLTELGKSVLSSEFFAIMCDECTDSSNREQLSVCIRWVDSELEPPEDFIGLYKMDSVCASDIVKALYCSSLF